MMEAGFQRRQQSSSRITYRWILAFWIILIVVAFANNVIGIRKTIGAYLLEENDLGYDDSDHSSEEFTPPSSNADTDSGFEVTDHSPWCPFAVKEPPSKYDRRGCRPNDRRFLIIITTGRSASTTLTWMLNTLPGIRMSGEINNLMGHLFDFYSPPAKLLANDTRSDRMGAWYRNPVTKSSLACAVQNIVETINPPMPIDPSFSHSAVEKEMREEREMIIGFKTIRLLHDGRRSVKEASKLVNFMVEMLPCARFVINIRSDVIHQSESQKKFDDEEDMRSPKELEMENDILERIARKTLGPDRAIFLDSSEWTKNLKALNNAVEWLGFSQECFFSELMELNTKGIGYAHRKQKLKPHKPGCRYLGGKS